MIDRKNKLCTNSDRFSGMLIVTLYEKYIFYFDSSFRLHHSQGFFYKIL